MFRQPWLRAGSGSRRCYVCTIEDGEGQARAASWVAVKERRGQQEAKRATGEEGIAAKLSRGGESVHWRSTRRSPLRRVLAAMGGMSKEAWRGVVLWPRRAPSGRAAGTARRMQQGGGLVEGTRARRAVAAAQGAELETDQVRGQRLTTGSASRSIQQSQC